MGVTGLFIMTLMQLRTRTRYGDALPEEEPYAYERNGPHALISVWNPPLLDLYCGDSYLLISAVEMGPKYTCVCIFFSPERKLTRGLATFCTPEGTRDFIHPLGGYLNSLMRAHRGKYLSLFSII